MMASTIRHLLKLNSKLFRFSKIWNWREIRNSSKIFIILRIDKGKIWHFNLPSFSWIFSHSFLCCKMVGKFASKVWVCVYTSYEGSMKSLLFKGHGGFVCSSHPTSRGQEAKINSLRLVGSFARPFRVTSADPSGRPWCLHRNPVWKPFVFGGRQPTLSQRHFLLPTSRCAFQDQIRAIVRLIRP